MQISNLGGGPDLFPQTFFKTGLQLQKRAGKTVRILFIGKTGKQVSAVVAKSLNLLLQFF